MFITDKRDGMHISGHGVISLSELVSGEYVLDPIKMRHALAKINRYAGNTGETWNDAEHSRLVAQLVHNVADLVDIEELFLARPGVVDRVRLYNWITRTDTVLERVKKMAHHWGLLHDLVEVIVGDMPNPVKHNDELLAVRLSGETTEDKLVAVIKRQGLGRYAMAVAKAYVNVEGSPSYACPFVADAVLDLMQDFVKPADKLALLIEMKSLHHGDVLDYVYRSWDVNPETREFVEGYHWPSLRYQARSGCLDWKYSAHRWGKAVADSKKSLDELFGH